MLHLKLHSNWCELITTTLASKNTNAPNRRTTSDSNTDKLMKEHLETIWVRRFIFATIIFIVFEKKNYSDKVGKLRSYKKRSNVTDDELRGKIQIQKHKSITENKLEHNLYASQTSNDVNNLLLSTAWVGRIRHMWKRV